jgi:AraC-like DNA-binding protein
MQIQAEYSDDLDAIIHSAYDIVVLVQLLEQEGTPAATLLANSGISASSMSSYATRVSFRQKLIVFNNVMRLTKTPSIGLLAGQQVNFSHIGILGYALISSATFGKGLELGFKYIKLAGPVLRKTMSIENDMVLLEGKDPLSLGELLPLTTELWFSAMHSLMTDMLGRPPSSRRIELPYPAPPYYQQYADLFQCPVKFDSNAIKWYIDAELLAQPMPNANPLTAQACAQTCNNLLADLERQDDLEHQIRSMLLNNPARFSSIEEIARHHHISSRTLRRRLKVLGTSYQNIVDDTRRRLAIQYLENTELTIEEIAERVGFSEATNFSQAFKRWTGTSPSGLRKL